MHVYRELDHGFRLFEANVYLSRTTLKEYSNGLPYKYAVATKAEGKEKKEHEETFAWTADRMPGNRMLIIRNVDGTQSGESLIVFPRTARKLLCSYFMTFHFQIR